MHILDSRSGGHQSPHAGHDEHKKELANEPVAPHIDDNFEDDIPF